MLEILQSSSIGFTESIIADFMSSSVIMYDPFSLNTWYSVLQKLSSWSHVVISDSALICTVWKFAKTPEVILMSPLGVSCSQVAPTRALSSITSGILGRH